MAKNGVMMQDENGNLYFLRPEILAAAKLPKALHKDAQVALKVAKGTAGPKLKVVGALSLVSVDIDEKQSPTVPGALSKKAAVGKAVRGRIKTPRTSTIMCPW